MPAGNYPFKVTNFERSVYQPNPNFTSKVPTGTNMAVLTLGVTNPTTGETATLTEKLYLYKKGEWRISQFFVAIGQKKKGEPVRPNWQAVLGATGQAEVKVRNYTDKDGNPGQANDIKAFLEPATWSPQDQLYSQAQPATQQPQPQTQPPVKPFPGVQTGGYNFGG
ncbi:hypothetical protein [Lactococcus sp. UBA7128]|uniref:hypothetical protein n=1 Tax=Lactococcus sp. UBA7128 TaxID=1946733 RepID=UPI00257B3F83|nr:hypothetical protein [Lactococcus sp. UBA7128]